jgi:hypothetical protein
MFASHGLRAFALLTAVALSACSGDESTSQPPDGDELPAFTAGDAQVAPAVRTAISGLIVDLGTATGAAADPELAGVLGTIGAAMVGEGRITGVTAGSALRGSKTMSLVDGTWGVFGVAVAVYPAHDQPIKAWYTAVVALHGNQAAIGLKKANTEAEVRNNRGDFPDPKANGWLFQGRTQGWGAVEGYTQAIPKDFTTDCAGVSISGVTCQYGMTSAGLEIHASVPLSFSGNTASGSRQFTLAYGDVAGYYINVYCDEASFC